MYTSSDTRLEWAREGPLLKLDLNKRQGLKTGPLFESPPRSLLKSGLLPLRMAWGRAIIQVGLK